MVEGGMKCVKYLIFAFNLIFWLSGLGVIIVGALVQKEYSKYFSLLGQGFSSVPILLIVVGCIIAIIGFFGCCGAIKENYCMIITFAVLLGTIFILEVAAGIAAYVLKKEIDSSLRDGLKNHIDKYNKNDTDDPITKAINYMQIDFHCCGIENYTDWNNLFHNDNYPKSCCKNQTDTCKSEQDDFQNKGCWKAFKDFMIKRMSVLIGVGVGIAFIQVFGVILACCLGRAIRKEYEVV